MIQIFFNKGKISENDWNIVYQNILKITHEFPLKLQRLESYDGFSPKLNKLHYDLTLNSGKSDEHISFYGDQMSYTAKYTVVFYKNWEIQKTQGLSGNETDESKPVAWFTPEVFDFSGYPPKANGCGFRASYLDTEGALYEYAILAIGIMLENYLPGRVFMVALENSFEEIAETIQWLEGVFKEDFDIPVYFDKLRLVEILKDHYKSKKDLIGRLDMLYMRQFKQNMIFAIKHFGYQPALDYYSHVLSNTQFGTFGFSDVLNPWIDASNNLESVLELVAKSKEILLSDENNLQNLKEAQEYNFLYLLNKLLDNFILWTPKQREFLEHFYTNKKAIETGEEDLFESMMRISGYRIDICPVYASARQLFEAFMFFDPKNGNEYQQIIDEWIENNKNAYSDLVEEITKIENKSGYIYEVGNENQGTAINPDYTMAINNFAKQYSLHEQFLVIKALKINPAFMDIDIEADNLRKKILALCANEKLKTNIKYRLASDKDEKIRRIKATIKEKGLSVHPNFELWIESENDTNILASIDLLVALKIYERGPAFARQHLLMNHEYWPVWKKGGEFEIIDSNP